METSRSSTQRQTSRRQLLSCGTVGVSGNAQFARARRPARRTCPEAPARGLQPLPAVRTWPPWNTPGLCRDRMSPSWSLPVSAPSEPRDVSGVRYEMTSRRRRQDRNEHDLRWRRTSPHRLMATEASHFRARIGAQDLATRFGLGRDQNFGVGRIGQAGRGHASGELVMPGVTLRVATSMRQFRWCLRY
jgi:hypothetical protein